MSLCACSLLNLHLHASRRKTRTRNRTEHRGFLMTGIVSHALETRLLFDNSTGVRPPTRRLTLSCFSFCEGCHSSPSTTDPFLKVTTCSSLPGVWIGLCSYSGLMSSAEEVKEEDVLELYKKRYTRISRLRRRTCMGARRASGLTAERMMLDSRGHHYGILSCIAYRGL